MILATATKYPMQIPIKTNDFHIGTIKNPKNLDSHAWRNKWTVNCINHWVASLGQKLTLKNATQNHLVIILHELTHAMSGIKHGDESDRTLYYYDWDDFLDIIVNEVS